MQPGDLIFIRGTEGMAGPIKKVTRSPYTHIAGIVLDGHVLESQALRRTGHLTLETYKGVSDVYTCPVLSMEQRHEIVQAATKWLGAKYDYLLFGFLAFKHLLRLDVPVYGGKKRQICTTLWTDAYRSVGIELCPGIEYPTPGELAESALLRKVGSF
ncbi:C40 family peptidase [Alicyclobacillus mengziensis]|uniref:Permuted papain-like amidase YaeF/Yiix C92 family enzyme n=1 Tax=Alicyclobacillus mengziensis TaxID=2931921 RepID=A0A9X7VY37_9BACL|nr:hypothetical protein [Alicyclobacillus mengziensis]QSO46900.1 hypothetical protein JZ786_21115 [Alicyclobacillus mengziensis]